MSQDPPLTMRLNRFLARAGCASRRHSDLLIEQGVVAVNGTYCRCGASHSCPVFVKAATPACPVMLAVHRAPQGWCMCRPNKVLGVGDTECYWAALGTDGGQYPPAQDWAVGHEGAGTRHSVPGPCEWLSRGGGGSRGYGYCLSGQRQVQGLGSSGNGSNSKLDFLSG